MDLRVGRAGNGTPVFTAHGQHQTFGRVFGAAWDESRALWMYPAFFPASTKVITDLHALSKDVRITYSDAATQHIQALEQVSADLVAKTLPPDFTFVTKPFAHQIDGLCHVYYNLRSALFYDPGLGKSKIAIDLLRLLRHRGLRTQALILGPRVTIQNWGREIDTHSGRQLSWSAITGTAAEKRDAVNRIAEEAPDVVLATYDTARSLVDLLVSTLPYRILICDEAHNVKSWTSNRTRATWEIAQKASRRVNMTGSPTQGTPIDLYGQYRILGDCFMPEEYMRYKKKFCEFAGENSRIVVSYKNLDILNARTTFLSTRKRKEECLDLPERTFVDIEYSLTPMQGAIHNQLVNEMKLDPDLLAAQLGLEPGRHRMPPRARMPHRAATLAKLLQVASGFLIKNESDPSFCDTVEEGGCRYLETCVEHRIRPRTADCQIDQTPLPNTITTFDDNPKMDAVEELLDTLLDDPMHKVIVWCVFTHELNLVEERLIKRGKGYVRVDGETVDMQAQIDKFNDEADTRVYLAQVTTGVGITLNAAQYMIFYSVPYSLTTYTQAVDRNYRIGQTKNVTMYRLLGRGTPEPGIAKLLDNKVDVDNVLTKKIDCLVCPESIRCFAQGVEPFDPTCIYPRKIARPAIRAHALPMLPEE
jgi:SNF2 family DNA or RNA helicase